MNDMYKFIRTQYLTPIATQMQLFTEQAGQMTGYFKPETVFVLNIVLFCWSFGFNVTTLHSNLRITQDIHGYQGLKYFKLSEQIVCSDNKKNVVL